MYTVRAVTVASVAITLVIAGCASSSQRSNAASASPSTSSAATAPSSTSNGAYGPAQPTTSAAGSAGSPALIATKHVDRLGLVLAVGSKRLTVYLFEADRDGHPSCTGACAKVWPPVTGTPKAVGGAIGADLGTLTRRDGVKQVTYKGHPLYTYVRDKDDGDTYGQGITSFGAPWYSLSPSGGKVDPS